MAIRKAFINGIACTLFFLLGTCVPAQVAVCAFKGDVENFVRHTVAEGLSAKGVDVVPFEQLDMALAAQETGEMGSKIPFIKAHFSSEKVVWGEIEENNFDLQGRGEGWRLRLHWFDQTGERYREFDRLAVGLPKRRALRGLVEFWLNYSLPDGLEQVREGEGDLGGGKGRPEIPSSGFMTNRGQDARRRMDRDSQAGKGDEMLGFVVFSPPLYNRKRWTTFDDMDVGYQQRVRPSGMLPVSAEPIPPGWLRYEGRLQIILEAGKPKSIPSVSPRMKVASFYPGPRQGVELFRDQADNYYLVSDRDAVTDFSFVVGEEPQYDNSRLPENITFAQLARGPVVRLPAEIGEKAAEAVGKMGLELGGSPAACIDDLVAYYQGFDPDEEISGTEGDLYLAITLSKAGVCRHRAFSFFVTANYLGIPTRIVENEVHAFVEVFFADAGWRRLDLGGGIAKVNYTDGSTAAEAEIVRETGLGRKGVKEGGESRSSLGKLFKRGGETFTDLTGNGWVVWLVVLGGGGAISLVFILLQRFGGTESAGPAEKVVPVSSPRSADNTVYQVNAEIVLKFEMAFASLPEARPSGATYREFASHLGQRFPGTASALMEALQIYEKTRYGRGEVNSRISQRLGELLEQIEKEMKSPEGEKISDSAKGEDGCLS
jgi:hypothetical protein